jgi:SnoaL-like domain
VHGVEGFIEAVERGSIREAADHLGAGFSIDCPRQGRIAGNRAAKRWLESWHAWLDVLSARAEPGRLTAMGRHAVLERLLHVRVDGEKRQLPLAIAADEDDRELLSAVRIYHSFWTVERGHRVRGRLLPACADIAIRPPVDRYQRALASGDVDGVLACYAPNATVREPAGEPFVHRGLRGLRRLYGTMLLNGGLPLELARVVDDGVACAIEYTIVRWGRASLPPQAGVAVYERNASGLIGSTRIYDDVDPPLE